MPSRFPHPNTASPEGIVAVGGDLSPELLVDAYEQGIFPWPVSGVREMTWFCPPKRGILEWSGLHVPRSLGQFRKKSPYVFSFDRAFEDVIRNCAKSKRPGQRGTWITAGMIGAYTKLFELGIAHSVEAWEGDSLVGGVYGVFIKGVFSGESMFHRAPNASKLALLHLMERLHSLGVEWIDIQMVTPHLEAMGAREISREDYLGLLAASQREVRWDRLAER